VSSTILDDLEARGLVQDTTDRAALAERLAAGPVSLYHGCDPTADSLHIGNLIGLLVLRRFQDAGHRPIALAGGATGMVGDPSGRSDERNLLDEATLTANVAKIKDQMRRIVDLDDDGGGGKGGNRGKLVDNRDWTVDVTLLDFLRDVGKHVTVNQMLARESVKTRLGSEHGISFTEFSYMLLQARDYLWLYEHEGVELQVGGSDQWGNIVQGVDLIRRVRGRPAHALSWPLLTAPDGSKLGKTTGARIWLDPDKTSPYRFFQHWVRTDDRQVREFLAKFTLLPLGEIDEIVAAHEQAPEKREGQLVLAREVTRLVHGEAAEKAAEEASNALFGGNMADLSLEGFALVAREVPWAPLPAGRQLGEGLDVVPLLVETGLASSRSDARRSLEQGAVAVNGERAAPGRQIGPRDLRHNSFVVLRKGKKHYAVLVSGPQQEILRKQASEVDA
jgi:tyrosyl-tRNA synthetase